MGDDKFQQDFFGSASREKKGKKPRLLSGYSKQRFLPYVKIPIEYTVIIAIGMLVLVIISYAVGVERGKRFTPTSSVEAVDLASGKEFKEEPDVERTSLPVIEKKSLAEIDKEPEAEPEAREDADPYSGSRDDYVGAPPEEGASPVTISGYTIQIASFKTESSAKDEIKKLASKGFEAHISRVGDWYQVYAVGYETIEQARGAQKKLAEKYQDCYIKKVK